MFDGMKHMAKTPHEIEQGDVPSQENIYPYNLSISLTNDELEKLDLDCSDPECEVGNYVHLHALAEVVGKSKNDTGDGEKHCLNLQITHLEIEDEGAENDEADQSMAGQSSYGG